MSSAKVQCHTYGKLGAWHFGYNELVQVVGLQRWLDAFFQRLIVVHDSANVCCTSGSSQKGHSTHQRRHFAKLIEFADR
jgi:hypothetical protein